MNKYFRKLTAALTIIALFLNLLQPVVVSAQETTNQKATIDKAVADFQGTYDKIMAVKLIEISPLKKAILDLVYEAENYAEPEMTNGQYPTPEQVTAFQKAQAARLEKAKYESYVAQIEQANKDIRKLQWDAIKTNILLTNGEFKKAAETNPSEVFGSLDQNSSALSIYQDVLRKAGQTLLNAANALSTASTALAGISAICTLISLGCPPAAPVTGPIAILTADLSGIISGVATVLLTGGNSLVRAADEAITDDAELATIFVEEGSKAVVIMGFSYVSGKLIGTTASSWAPAAAAQLPGVADPNKVLATELILKKAIGKASSPANNAVQDLIYDSTTTPVDSPVDRQTIEDISLENSDGEKVPASKANPGLGLPQVQEKQTTINPAPVKYGSE
jgi:hypothetical protein